MFDNVKSVSAKIGEKEITFTTGQMARQADGAVVAVVGDTQVLVTAVAKRDIREGQDFFPLTVDVEERMYAVGRIPGSFFRREGRATEKATLTARLIDRPLRPSFREGFLSETHIVATVMAVDLENPYDVIALNGASAALSSSPIPFEGPVGAVRLGYRNGNWEPFPTYQDLEDSVFDLLVAGVKNSQDGIDVIMVEAGATEEAVRLIEGGQPATDEDAVAKGLEEAKDYIRTLIDTQLELRSMVEIDEVEYDFVVPYTDEHVDMVNGVLGDRLLPVISLTGKKERGLAQSELKKEVVATIMGDNDDQDFEKSLKKAFDAVAKKTMRNRVVKEGIRLDGRGPTDLRQLDAQIGVLPRAHGSALFTRGETQVLNVTTLGMLRMEQMLDTIDLNESKRYMHHYNFPPFSTGETGFMRGPKRREIGHGALAEKALLPVIPDPVEFPYAFRLVSEVLASNGSSSMASVCGSSLSLMDAGVPISGPVAGIAMGVIAQDGEFVTLTDILGAEDALGDMDFKVAGTAETITAMQLDTKIEGLPSEVLSKALYQAKEARTAILEVMNAAIATPREEMRPYTPRIEAVQVPKDKIGEVIGPKGKMIRQIEEDTGAVLDIEDDGTIRIGAADSAALEAAKELVMSVAFPPEPELGVEYEGEIVNITKFGAFVNIMIGRDGLLHISKMGGGSRVDKVEDVYSLGDKVKVVVEEIDRNGKISLNLAGAEPTAKREGGDRDRGDRDGGRDRDRDRGGRDGGRDRGGRERNDRDRGGNRDRDKSRSSDGQGDGNKSRRPKHRNNDGDRGREPARSGRDSGGRKMVSFEDEFEG